MEFTPKQIVEELNRYIIGQNDAKKSVAVALRNRYRRNALNEELREEITPKNIIMKGPTGVGKTEIARRLAKIVKAPFIKVEATKFTEVGYVGRDVESMIRDLVEMSIRMVKEEKIEEIKPRVNLSIENNLVKILMPLIKPEFPELSDDDLRDKVQKNLSMGHYENIQIEMDIAESPKPLMIGGAAGAGIEMNIGDMLGGMVPKRKRRKKLFVKDARRIMLDEEASRLIDSDTVNTEALRRAEQEGIIFIDEIDKIASKANHGGADVSREGVQRDILPIVEGCTVTTKYGSIKTDYILFIAAGAFHIATINDLIPELQGRFPVRVELSNLTSKDFIDILTCTDNAILRQYAALLKVDNIDLKFSKEAIETIASIAQSENENSENLGARRLHALMEKLLEDISFNAGGLDSVVDVLIDKKYVNSHLESSIKALNLRKYII